MLSSWAPVQSSPCKNNFEWTPPLHLTERLSSICGQSSVSWRIFLIYYLSAEPIKLGIAGSAVALDPCEGTILQGHFWYGPWVGEGNFTYCWSKDLGSAITLTYYGHYPRVYLYPCKLTCSLSFKSCKVFAPEKASKPNDQRQRGQCIWV